MNSNVIEKYTGLSKSVAGSEYLNSAYNEYCERSEDSRFYREAAQARAESARAKKRGRDQAAGNVMGPSPEGREYAEKIASLRDQVSRRLREGYHHEGGTVGGDERYRVGEVHHQGFVSDQDFILKLFIKYTSKKVLSGQIRSRLLTTPRIGKVIALDDDCIDGIDTCRGFMRDRLKGTFCDLENLTLKLSECGVKLPNIIVCPVVGDEGELIDPELIWLLKSPVTFGGKSHRKPQRAYSVTKRSMTYALLGLGADVESLSAPMLGLNPLSPRLQTWICAPEPYSLSELGEGLERRVTDGMLGIPADFSSAIIAKVTRGSPLTFWQSVLRCACREVIHHWTECWKNWESFVRAVGKYAKYFGERYNAGVTDIARVATKISNWVWNNHDPEKVVRKISGMGPCAEETKNLSVSEAQAVGGRYTSSRRRSATIEVIRRAYWELVRQGYSKPCISEIARMTGRCVRTVKTHIAMVRAEAENPTIIKKCKSVIPVKLVSKSDSNNMDENLPNNLMETRNSDSHNMELTCIPGCESNDIPEFGEFQPSTKSTGYDNINKLPSEGPFAKLAQYVANIFTEKNQQIHLII